MTIERIECKASFTAGDAGAIEGLAWLWAQPDRVNDMIEPKAFASATPPVPMLFAHNPAKPVGAWNALTVKQDGLHVAGKLLIDDSPLAREVYAFVRAGAVKGLSIGFETKRATSRKGGGRTITALDLAEISLVTIPMHPGARVSGVKSAAAAIALANAITRAAAALKL